MLRRGQVLLEFKQTYHRIHLPRRINLEHHLRRLRTKEANKAQKTEGKGKGGNVKLDGQNIQEPYKYNRWWVTNNSEFLHQHAYVEDPEVIRDRRMSTPDPTSEKLWKTPFEPHMMPFVPYIPVVDYPKDPDVKNLKPINVPRWKDYMFRHTPVVPRTWY